jgi:hypothetical protein
MQVSETITKMVLLLTLLLGGLFTLSVGKVAATPVGKLGMPEAPVAESYALDIVFEGTWAFVVGSDGAITAYTPRLKDHSRPYIRGLDERQLPMGEYTVSIDKYVPPTQMTDYDSSAPHSEYKLAYTKVDTKGAEYLSIHLPKPTSFVPLHWDLQEFKNTDPGATPATNAVEYPTIMALRYDLSDITTVKVDCPNTGVCPYNPNIPKLGNQQLLVVEVDPLEPDQPTHDHARSAFHQLVSLFPEFKLWVAFPGAPPKEKALLGPGKDCRASMLLLLPQSLQEK